MEDFLQSLASGVALAVETVAVVVAGLGALVAVAGIVRVEIQGAPRGARKDVWRTFGLWLLFALEFALAADIIRSVIAPGWQEIGKLAAIAAIRTFLNYYLEKDVREVERAPSPH